MNIFHTRKAAVFVLVVLSPLLLSGCQEGTFLKWLIVDIFTHRETPEIEKVIDEEEKEGVRIGLFPFKSRNLGFALDDSKLMHRVYPELKRVVAAIPEYGDRNTVWIDTLESEDLDSFYRQFDVSWNVKDHQHYLQKIAEKLHLVGYIFGFFTGGDDAVEFQMYFYDGITKTLCFSEPVRVRDWSSEELSESVRSSVVLEILQ